MADSSAVDGYSGQLGVTGGNSEFNHNSFQIAQALAGVNTTKLVKIMAITGGGGALAAAGTVDVQILANQLDGQGNATPHGTTFSLPYHRHQGGPNAIIMDPVVGDIGTIHVADRDISGVLATQGQANPGSFRRHHISDSIYHGGVVNKVPTQYVQFLSNGITIADMNGNKVILTNGSIQVIPKSGSFVYLGGTGSDGTYDFVLTPSGPSINTKTRIG
jgi:hypothetical protein